jgi:hypothetical protein
MKVIKRPPKMKLIGIERWSYREPPRFRRILPPEIPGATSDWDFNQSAWNLDTATYISSPSSMKFGDKTIALCKYAGTTNIPQGQMVSWAKVQSGGTPYFSFMFRNQSSIGTVNNPNAGYRVQFDAYHGWIYIYRDTTSLIKYDSLLKSPSSWTTWNKYRVTWWTDPGGAGLIIRVELWNGSTWDKMVNDTNDSLDEYKTSTLNRVGGGSTSSYIWFDDTEIWSA